MNGINFTEAMFNAAIEGRKSQTRRIANYDEIDTTFKSWTPDGEKKIYLLRKKGKIIKPRYKVGDTVYIKEPYRITEPSSHHVLIELKYSKSENYIDILKHKSLSDASEWIDKRLKEQSKSKNGFCNKLFIPEFCAVKFIEITGVRCERLQDISYEDCRAEGLICDGSGESFRFYFQGSKYTYPTPQQAYAALINSINGKGTWENNPYVWCYEFKLVNNK